MMARDQVLRLLSRESAGLWVAAAVAALGVLLMKLPPFVLRQPLALLLLVAGLVSAAGAVRHLHQLARVRRAHPPPGRLVDVGGFRMHLLAEGSAAGGAPSIVWLSGGHATTFVLHHLHQVLRAETRSILIDRPGTGWSEVGGFPRSTAREADEIVRALECAGESGPFVLVGHSFGGLLAANIARRRPDLVHTLVLLDPTPLDVIAFGPPLPALRRLRADALKAGLAQLFGVNLGDALERRVRRDPGMASALDAVQARQGADAAAASAVERASAGAKFARASIFAELDATDLMPRAWDTVVYDGDLGDLSVLLVAPRGPEEMDVLSRSVSADERERRRVVAFFERCRERYLAVSTNSRRVHAPDGASHNFPFEAPEFVVGLVRDLLRRDPVDAGMH